MNQDSTARPSLSEATKLMPRQGGATLFRPTESASPPAPESQDDLKLLNDPVDAVIRIIRQELEIADIKNPDVLVQLKLAADSDGVIEELLKSGLTIDSVDRTIMLVRLDFMLQLARVSKS